MAKFLARYGTEAKCYRALYTARWPLGFRCPCCNGGARSRFSRAGRVYYQSRACRHQTTLTSGTLFEASKVRLTTWFLTALRKGVREHCRLNRPVDSLAEKPDGGLRP